jgi:hypothetical protein
MSNIVSDLFLQRFGPAGDPRSPEFLAGVMACLMFKAKEVEELKSPYKPGTASRDAYEAGIQEGIVIWRQHLLRAEIEKARRHGIDDPLMPWFEEPLSEGKP